MYLSTVKCMLVYPIQPGAINHRLKIFSWCAFVCSYECLYSKQKQNLTVHVLPFPENPALHEHV